MTMFWLIGFSIVAVILLQYKETKKLGEVLLSFCIFWLLWPYMNFWTTLMVFGFLSVVVIIGIEATLGLVILLQYKKTKKLGEVLLSFCIFWLLWPYMNFWTTLMVFGFLSVVVIIGIEATLGLVIFAIGLWIWRFLSKYNQSGLDEEVISMFLSLYS